MLLVFDSFTTRPHLSQYSCSLTRHDWSPSFEDESNSKSSAQERLFILISPILTGWQPWNISWISFWKILDNIGLKLQPCFTPLDELKFGDITPLIITKYYGIMEIHLAGSVLREWFLTINHLFTVHIRPGGFYWYIVYNPNNIYQHGVYTKCVNSISYMTHIDHSSPKSPQYHWIVSYLLVYTGMKP